MEEEERWGCLHRLVTSEIEERLLEILERELVPAQEEVGHSALEVPASKEDGRQYVCKVKIKATVVRNPRQ